MKILTVSQMQQAEQDSVKRDISLDTLMENAGKAVARETERITGGVFEKRILVLAGPGNNGGDGLVVARHLHDWRANVTVYICGKRQETDPKLEQVKERNITYIQAELDTNQAALNDILVNTDLVIDSIFGTGKSRELTGIFRDVLMAVKKAKEKRPDITIIAVDLPSGLNADAGAVDEATPCADYTITLGFPKVGLFNFPGVERAGQIILADIGIPLETVDYVKTELITREWVKSVLPRRHFSANKGSFGKVLVSAGSINYTGAPYLACTAAMRAGAGLVTLAAAASIQSIPASKMIETTYLPLPESSPGIIATEAGKLILKADYDVLLIGPGLGTTEPVAKYVRDVLSGFKKQSLKVVIDADGLNILSKIPKWWEEIISEAILTPHPGEMSRLTGKTVSEVQENRIQLAGECARKWNKTIVLKGAYTVVAEPGGRLMVSMAANAGLASAGTGDVLAGVISGMAAQGLSLFEAACCGVYLHAQAGEMVREQMGDAGMLASDLLPVLPLVIRQVKEN